MEKMSQAQIAIVAGTGIADLFNVKQFQEFNTSYGPSSLGRLRIGSRDVIILLRHGIGYTIPPHRINYRANIFSLKESGVKSIFASSAVGSMRRSMKPGDLVLVDQVVDFTKGRSQTYFDGESGKVVFTDVTNPYSDHLRHVILKATKKLHVKMHQKGTYLCTEGPRFETAGEIRLFRKLGCDVVGMTGCPEVFLARELGMDYASIAIVTNWAAGIAQKVTHEEVLEMMREKGPIAKLIIEEAISSIGEK